MFVETTSNSKFEKSAKLSHSFASLTGTFSSGSVRNWIIINHEFILLLKWKSNWTWYIMALNQFKTLPSDFSHFYARFGQILITTFAQDYYWNPMNLFFHGFYKHIRMHFSITKSRKGLGHREGIWNIRNFLTLILLQFPCHCSLASIAC